MVLPLNVYFLSLPLSVICSSISFSSTHLFFSSLSSSFCRWIWRWPCLARGKIRRSRCPCSGCPWSVSRCCSKLSRVTSTRSPRTPFRLWMSSRVICLPWGTDIHPSLPFLKRTTHIVFTSVSWLLLFFNLFISPYFLISCCLVSSNITLYNGCV